MRSLNLLGVLLGNGNQRASRFRSSSGKNGNEIFAKCLSWQQKVAKAVLSHKNRLPADQAFLAMEVIVHPKSLLSRDYVSEFYKPHLEEVCKYFKSMNIISSFAMGHLLFYKLISNSDLQKKYESYWFRKNAGTLWEWLRVSWTPNFSWLTTWQTLHGY